jgi:uncharacterized C2H2 Zn-finger protein
MTAPEQHAETIRCPRCDSIETAVIRHTLPWPCKAHTCEGAAI